MLQSPHVLYRIGQVHQRSIREDVTRQRQATAAARRDQRMPTGGRVDTMCARLATVLTGLERRRLDGRDPALVRESHPEWVVPGGVS